MLAAYWNFDCPTHSLLIDKRYHGYAVVRYQRVFYLCLDDGYRDHLETDEKSASQIMVTTVTESLGTFLMVSLTLLVFDGGCLTRIPGITERLRQKV